MASNNSSSTSRVSVRSTGKGSIIITSGNSNGTSLLLPNSSCSSSSSISLSGGSQLNPSSSTSKPINRTTVTHGSVTGSTYTQALYPFLSPLRKPLPKSTTTTTKSESSDTDTIGKESVPLSHSQSNNSSTTGSGNSSSLLSSSVGNDDMLLTLSYHNRYNTTTTNAASTISGTTNENKLSQRKGQHNDTTTTTNNNTASSTPVVPVVSRAKTNNTKGASTGNSRKNNTGTTATTMNNTAGSSTAAPYDITYETTTDNYYPMMDDTANDYMDNGWNASSQNGMGYTEDYYGQNTFPVPYGDPSVAYHGGYDSHPPLSSQSYMMDPSTGMVMYDTTHHPSNHNPYGNYNAMYDPYGNNLMPDPHSMNSSYTDYNNTTNHSSMMMDESVLPVPTHKRNSNSSKHQPQPTTKGNGTKGSGTKTGPSKIPSSSQDPHGSYPVDYYSSVSITNHPHQLPPPSSSMMMDQQLSMGWRMGAHTNSVVNVRPVVDMGIIIPSNAYPSSIPTTITWKETMEVWKQIQVQEQQMLALQQEQYEEQQRKLHSENVASVHKGQSSTAKTMNDKHNYSSTGTVPYPNGGLLGPLTENEMTIPNHQNQSLSSVYIDQRGNMDETMHTNGNGSSFNTPYFSSLSMLQLSSQYMRSQAITKVILQQSSNELESGSKNDTSLSSSSSSSINNSFTVTTGESATNRPIVPSPTIAVPITVPLSDIIIRKSEHAYETNNDLMDTTDTSLTSAATTPASSIAGTHPTVSHASTTNTASSIITDHDIQVFTQKLIQNFIVPENSPSTVTVPPSTDTLKSFLYPHVQHQLSSSGSNDSSSSPSSSTVTVEQEKRMLELLINEIQHIVDRTEQRSQVSSTTATPSSSSVLPPYVTNDLTVPTVPLPTDTLQTLSEANNELQILADARARNHYQLLQNHPYTAKQLHNIQVAFMRSRQEAIRTFMSAEAGLEAALDTGKISAVIYTTRMKEIRTRTNTRIAQLQTQVREEIENLVNQIPLLAKIKSTTRTKGSAKTSPERIMVTGTPTTVPNSSTGNDSDSNDPIVRSHRRAGFTTPSWRKSLHDNPQGDPLSSSPNHGSNSLLTSPHTIVTIATHAGEPPIQVSVPSVPDSHDHHHHHNGTVIPISLIDPKKAGTTSTTNDLPQPTSQDVLLTAAAQIQVQHPKPVHSTATVTNASTFVTTPIGNRNFHHHHRVSPENHEIIETINQDQLDRRTSLLLSANLFTPSPSSHFLIPEIEETEAGFQDHDYPEINRHQIRRMLTPGTADAATQLSLARMVMADASGTLETSPKVHDELNGGTDRKNTNGRDGGPLASRFVTLQETETLMNTQEDPHHLLQSPSVRPIRHSTTIVGKGHAK